MARLAEVMMGGEVRWGWGWSWGSAESHHLTWVHLTVAADSIRIHDALET